MLRADVYVDGSYDRVRNVYGYGAVLLVEGKEPEYISGIGRASSDPGENGWNINGELKAASVAIAKALNIGVTDLTIYHDYMGIGAWADGKWKGKHKYIHDYIADVQEARKSMHITFIHVKGHSGNKWNTKADELAGEGAQMPFSGEDL